jgi:hypothetical protein
MGTILLTFTLFRGADLATTHAVLRQGGHEGTPWLPQSAPWNLAIGSAVTAAQVVGLRKLSAQHPQIARWIGVAGIGVEAAVVARNVRQIR